MKGQIFLDIKDSRLAAWLTSNPVQKMPMYSHAAFEKWAARCMVITSITDHVVVNHWPLVPGADQR